MLPALLLLWFLGAAAVGFVAARVVLAGERRLAVLTAFALGSGQSIQGLALLLWGYLPPGSGFFVTVALSILIAAVFAVRSRTRHLDLTWGMSRVDTLATVALVSATALAAHYVFTIGYRSWDAELLFFHSAIVDEITRGTYPAMNPLEPDDLLRYRIALHSLAAAISANVSEPPVEVLAAVMAVTIPLLPVSAIGASMRLLRSPRPGMISALLALLGGSLLPYYRVAELLTLRNEPSLDWQELVNGLVWHGNTLDMIHISPTIALGAAVFAIAAWLVSEALDSARSPWISGPVAAVGLGYLGLVNEVYFVMLMVGVLACAGLRPVLSRFMRTTIDAIEWKTAAAAVGIVAGGLVIVGLQGGLGGGIRLFGSPPNSMDIVPNVEHFGDVVAPPRGDFFWIPLSSMATQVDTDFAVLGIPLLTILAVRTNSGYALRALLAAAAGLAAWMTMYSREDPNDLYRLGQAAMTLYLYILPLTIPSIQPRVAGLSTFRRWIAPLAVAALIMPHLLFVLSVLGKPPEQSMASTAGPDYAASQVLRQSVTTRRVFVPFEGAGGNAVDLYRPDGSGAAMRQLLAFSRHAIPMGFWSYLNPGAYLPRYHRASLTFDHGSLLSLKIDWVYVLPSRLNREQRANLEAAKDIGELALTQVFGAPGTAEERWLFRVTGNSRED